MTTLMTIPKTQYPSMDDARLAQHARTDLQAFAELYRRHVRSIHRYHLAHTGNVGDAAKTEFVVLDAGNTISELRSFTRSADGEQLAIIGITMGSGNIYLTDPGASQLQPVLPTGELGYLLDVAWSRDGKQFVIWSSQNNTAVYLMNTDGTSLLEKQLDMQIFSTPQFGPDNQSIVFYGADLDSNGLFELTLANSQVRLISAQVEDETGFAFSHDGSRLAYVEMDRNAGEARLIMQEFATGDKTVLGTLPIPRGSGSSLPESANLSWSVDATSLVFDFGRNAADRAIYLAYAPSVSADGKCLAYIRNNQIFLMNLTGVLQLRHLWLLSY